MTPPGASREEARGRELIAGLVQRTAQQGTSPAALLAAPQLAPLCTLRQPERRAEQPLTRSVAAALAGKSGVDVAGYRDYRGVPSVGAWSWLEDLDVGLVTEVNVAQALGPLRILRLRFGFILALLVLAAVAVFLLMRLARACTSPPARPPSRRSSLDNMPSMERSARAASALSIAAIMPSCVAPSR